MDFAITPDVHLMSIVTAHNRFYQATSMLQETNGGFIANDTLAIPSFVTRTSTPPVFLYHLQYTVCKKGREEDLVTCTVM